MKFNFLLLFFLASFQSVVYPQAHNWHSPSEVVKNIKEVYGKLEGYSASFNITTKFNKNVKVMKGDVLYKNPGMIKYTFNVPQGDEIVSNGKTLWIYIKSINAVGKQDLTLDKKNRSGRIFGSGTAVGLTRLFRKYHYKFNSINQPQLDPEDGRQYFVLAMDQREKTGGYEKMLLYVDSEDFLIRKTVAVDGRGKETTIQFGNYKLNPDIEAGEFNYHISGNAKIVNNPLVTE